MHHHPHRQAFTLIELLVVISIIALLIGILLPALGGSRREARALGGSRREARAIACASNARQVTIAMQGYTVENKGYFPASYLYASPGDQWSGSGPAGVQWDYSYQHDANSNPPGGYIHWSYHLFNSGAVDENAFACPQMENGGLPATNPHGDAKHDRQTLGAGVGVDRQARWMAYTANESVIPRNKFNSGSSPQRFVRASQVIAASDTIMVTEFLDNYEAIADGSGVSKSHRPIQPFWPFGGAGIADATSWSAGVTLFPFHTSSSTLDLGSLESILGSSQIDSKPINAIGRHHPGGTGGVGEEGTANFAFVDGHTKRMTVRASLAEKHWGRAFYSITGSPKVIQGVPAP